jgi:hypothetical protein
MCKDVKEIPCKHMQDKKKIVLKEKKERKYMNHRKSLKNKGE